MRKRPLESVVPETYIEIANIVKDAMKGDTKVLPRLREVLGILRGLADRSVDVVPLGLLART